MTTHIHPLADRPEILYAEIYHRDTKREVAYIETEEVPSPVLTDHLSTLYFEIARGSGWIATKGMVAYVHPGSHVEIPAGQKFQYGGSMDMLIESTPPTNPAFVTTGDEKLGGVQKMMVQQRVKQERKKNRQQVREQALREFMEQHFPGIEQTMDFMTRIDATSGQTRMYQ